MKKTSNWILGAILAFSVCAVAGCSGGADGAPNQETIDKYNKDLPPIDPNEKGHVPVHPGGGGPKKGG